MSSPLKIGAASGLLAGIIGSMISFPMAVYILNIGLQYWGLEQLSTIPTEKIVIGEIMLNIILWIILGIVYSRIYDLIPGKGISKGLVFGLVYSFIYCIRWAVWWIMYSWPFLGWIYLISVYLSTGLVLGIIYELFGRRYITGKEMHVATKYDFKGGIYPGAIAGIVGGTISFFGSAIIFNPQLWPKYAADVGFLVGQLGSHVLFNMIWGIVFGMLFAVLYEKIPSKGILKGLIFGVVLYLITTFQNSTHEFMYGLLIAELWPLNSIYGLWALSAVLSVFVPFGLVFVALYRKPSD